MSRYRMLGWTVIKSQLTLSKLCNLQADTGKLMILARWNLSIKPYLVNRCFVINMQWMYNVFDLLYIHVQLIHLSTYDFIEKNDMVFVSEDLESCSKQSIAFIIESWWWTLFYLLHLNKPFVIRMAPTKCISSLQWKISWENSHTPFRLALIFGFPLCCLQL